MVKELFKWMGWKKNFLNPERNKTSHLVAGNLNVIFDYLLENS